jgi:Hypoxia induced protein conserved region
MQTILYHSTTIAVVVVFVVLLFGLYTMMRGTSPNLSQKVMRWRVGLQFVAIIIIMAAVYAKKHFV